MMERQGTGDGGQGTAGRIAARLLTFSAGMMLAGCAPPLPPPTAYPGDQRTDQTIEQHPAPQLLDDFESIAAWTAAPSDGVGLALASDSGHTGRALRMDVDFHGGGGYAVAHRALPVDFPENYELSFWIRGTIPPNNLEFKLIDASGDNVWWVNRRDFVYPNGWTRVVIRRRHVSFAWGPLGGGDLKRSAALELAVTAGSGGRGSVWIDNLVLTPRPRPTDHPPAPTTGVANEAPGHSGELVVDGNPGTQWRSDVDSTAIAVDYQLPRETGGFTIDWDSLDFATDYAILVSPGDDTWQTVSTVRVGDGGRDYVYLPDADVRFIRLELRRSSRSRGYGIREIAIQPLAWSATRNDFFAAVARDAPRGSYPRYLLGEQSYWTITGVDGDSTEALVSEEGIVETGKARFSLEPFLLDRGRLVTWADGGATQSLERGYLPVPSIRRDAGDLSLTTTAFAAGAPGTSTLWVRYRVENRGGARATPTLFVALRPFQVNPSAQFLNGAGGAAIVRRIAWDRRRVMVNDTFSVIPLTPSGAFGATGFDGGNVVDALRRGILPNNQTVDDPLGAASGALSYALDIAPGAAKDVWISVPMERATPLISRAFTATEASAEGESRLAATAREWDAKLNRVGIDLPPSARRIANSIRSNLAYVLINRDGPSIQPGSRSYERSWIRDGSLTSTALLRLGHADDVRAFAEWYAPFQFASGKVPCCVDRRGADPVPENDSHGELIYLIAEYARHTGDRAFLARMWPHVQRSVAYIDSLRHSRMTAEYQTGEKRAFYGLLPESISHEGYSAKPMHSFWDDSFALRGLKDAAWIAEVLDRPERAAYARMRDDFQRDMMASYRASMAMHGIDFLPGSVELGDFDATSTTVAVNPGGAQRELPHPALERTFERYWEEFAARRDGRKPWDAYTPYEWRAVGTMVRLGWKDRALQAMDWFFTHQRPAAWNAWGEVIWCDPRETKFIGDLPHTWVGSDFIRSALDLFAYERDDEGVLVIAGGIPAAWVTEAPGVRIRNLSTHFGRLSYTMRAEGSRVRLRIEPGLRTPPGGLVIRSPLDRPLRSATADGTPVPVAGGAEVRLARVPREVVLRY